MSYQVKNTSKPSTKTKSKTDYRIYTIEDVKKHDKPDDFWMIIYNKVYDLTNFSKVHPGGVEVLFDCGGSDGSEAFEDVGHSDYAYQMLKPYLIGELLFKQQKKYDNIPKFDDSFQIKAEDGNEDDKRGLNDDDVEEDDDDEDDESTNEIEDDEKRRSYLDVKKNSNTKKTKHRGNNRRKKRKRKKSKCQFDIRMMLLCLLAV
ncbi:Cytochrome b5 [Candida maltosa Xu316]